MATAIYRQSTKEVLKVSLINQDFSQRDPVVYGVLTDPALPDGSQVREVSPDGTLGPWRILGFSKIADPLGNLVRNATAPEISTFAPGEAADEATLDAQQAANLFDTDPQFRKLFIAYSDILRGEFNLLRQWLMDFKTAAAGANNLSTFKDAVAGLPDLPDRDLTQLRDAIRQRISGAD